MSITGLAPSSPRFALTCVYLGTIKKKDRHMNRNPLELQPYNGWPNEPTWAVFMDFIGNLELHQLGYDGPEEIQEIARHLHSLAMENIEMTADLISSRGGSGELRPVCLSWAQSYLKLVDWEEIATRLMYEHQRDGSVNPLFK